MPSVQSIIDSHQPSLEPEVYQYIESLVDSAMEDGDDISEMLQNFLSVDESQQLISAIQSQEGRHIAKGDAKSMTSSVHKKPKVLSQPDDAREDDTHTPLPPQTQRIPRIDSDDKPKSKSQLRKEARMKKRNARKEKSKEDSNTNSAELVNDDHASAWKECQESDRLWGGRGRGGRGIRMTGNNFQNIHLPSVSLSYEGNELLVDSKMTIDQGHRYGLLGRNCVGKSTLLQKIEAGAIPGLPHGLVVRMVKQQVEGTEDQTALEALVAADEYRNFLLAEQNQVEKELDEGTNLEENAQRIGLLAIEWDAIDGDNAEKRAMEILKGLSFTQSMITRPTVALSGGWRMRLALAQALFVRSDLLLLDEVTNHLDLHGMAWLENYLTKKRDDNSPLTIILVSHDRSFLDAVCTDMIVMEHLRLTYHVGNYSDYKQKMAEKASRESQILDASERQRAKAVAFVQKQQQQSKKSLDPNKQRQAKMMKEKKLDRIGNYREDGKRYKMNSLKKLSEDYVRLAQKVVIEVGDPVVQLRFPNPVWPSNISTDGNLIEFEDVSFSYLNQVKPQEMLLRNVTLSITRTTKAAVVGANGCGKSSLVKLISGETDKPSQGKVWKHPNILIGHITQYSVEELNEFENLTVLQYAEKYLASGDAAKSVIAKASGNTRQYLGAFGLGGSHANRLIRALSGGERMRLCFATVLCNTIHILLLDEATNHIDFETMESLSYALRQWGGAVVMVSHNQSFLSGFCNELWSFSENSKGRVNISHDDTESFDEMFTRYKCQILSQRNVGAPSAKERTKMAKRAALQNAKGLKNTSLL